MQERARLVLCLARGEARPDELAAREGVSEPMLEAWVREFLHAAPEYFDEAMKHTVVQRGLASEGATTQQSGRIEDVGPLDLLQSLSIYRRPGHVLFFHPHGTSQLWFRDGQIVDASSGALRGAAAVHRIVGHQQGDFLVEVTGCDRASRIETSSQALIFEAARRLDEGQRVSQSLPAADVVLTVPVEDLMMTPGLDEHGRLVTKLFEPGATVGEVLERSPLGELETRTAMAALVESGLLRPTGALRPPEIPSLERRLEALQQVGFTTSRPIVTALMHEPLELQPIPPQRRPWAHAMIGGLLVGLMGTGAWLWMDGTPTQTAASAPAPTLVAPRPAVFAPNDAPIAVGTPAPPAAAPPPPALGEAEDTPAPAKTSSRRGKARSKSRSKPSVRSQERAASSTAAKADESSPKPRSAVSLLDGARKAYASGRGAEAYQLASRSHAQSPSRDAAELRVLAACLDDEPGKAHRALASVSRNRRNKLRQACKRLHGARVKRWRGR